MPARRRRLLSPTTFLRRSGFYRGVLGGSRGWLIVGAIAWAGRMLRRSLGRTEEVVALEVLQPGQVLRLEAIPAPTRRERKAQRQAERAQRRAAPRTR